MAVYWLLTAGSSEPVMVKFADSGSSKKKQGQGKCIRSIACTISGLSLSLQRDGEI